MAYEQQSSNHYPDPATQNYMDNSNHQNHSKPQNGFVMPEHNIHAPPQKVDEAVTSAFDRAGAETSAYASPELIARITQSVIKELQSNGIDRSTPVPSQGSRFSPPPQQPTIHQPIPTSPSTTSGASPNLTNRVYTPPSPHKSSDYPTPTPESQTKYVPEAPHSPREAKAFHLTSPVRSPSPQSQTSDSADKSAGRPRRPSRALSDKEETTLEKIWGQLFDEKSHPTARLGQFLRGLAVHIIEDYEPKHSIVITPNKMIKYYEDVGLADELYPWSTVFDDEHSSISRMYRDLACQHHLVQEKYDERPDIPGLTPLGFERWVTLLIQAHPDREFERLQKAVLEMPINNPDDKKERFPKEIPRRLFPGQGNNDVRDRIESSMEEHAAIELHRHSSREEHQARQSPTQTHRPSVAEPAYPTHTHRPSVSFDLPPETNLMEPSQKPSNIERERKPYSSVPRESIIDDTNPPSGPPPAKPIERERAPYTKQYDDDLRARDPVKPRTESVASSLGAQRMERSESNARSRPIPINGTRPMDVPKPEIHHHRAPSNAGRRRSPSFSRGTTHDFRRSDGDIRGYQPASSMPTATAPIEAVFDENDTQRYFDKQARDRVARRKAEEEAGRYGESPRRSYERIPPPRRDEYLSDEDWHRAGGRGAANGYDYSQSYGGPIYR